MGNNALWITMSLESIKQSLCRYHLTKGLIRHKRKNRKRIFLLRYVFLERAVKIDAWWFWGVIRTGVTLLCLTRKSGRPIATAFVCLCCYLLKFLLFLAIARSAKFTLPSLFTSAKRSTFHSVVSLL